MNEIPDGCCQCGCGKKTKLAPYNSKRLGWTKGEPIRFINGHNATGKLHYNWKGGKNLVGSKYEGTACPSHPRASRGGYVMNHILKAEKALGKYLPPKAVVHHHTLDKLVICEDQVYHMFIEKRTKAYRACGHVDWLLCTYCQKYDAPENIYQQPGYGQPSYHKSCRLAYKRRHYAKYRDRRNALRRQKYNKLRAQGYTSKEAEKMI